MAHLLPDVFTRHAQLPCLGRPSIRSALDACRFTVRVTMPTSETPMHFLRIYEIRAKILAEMPGRYAEQLRQSVLEFCAALKRQPPDCQVRCTSIALDNGLVIKVWERAETEELLGCLIGIDHRVAKDSQWDEFWGT